MTVLSGYLSIEGLLVLFARLLPKSGGADRSKFINDVFLSEGFKYGTDIVKILDSAATTDWGITSMKVVEVLAKSSISLWVISFLWLGAQDQTFLSPQPFQVDEVRACGRTFPQVRTSDRLYVDRRSFFANIDEVCNIL
jgi:hypothetical protein